MSGPAQADGRSPQASSAAVVREIEIVNKKGLHARASAKFVQTAEQFDAAITVTRGHETVGGTSIMGLMMLAAGARHHHHHPGHRQGSRRRGRCAVRAGREPVRRRGLGPASPLPGRDPASTASGCRAEFGIRRARRLGMTKTYIKKSLYMRCRAGGGLL